MPSCTEVKLVFYWYMIHTVKLQYKLCSVMGQLYQLTTLYMKINIRIEDGINEWTSRCRNAFVVTVSSTLDYCNSLLSDVLTSG